MSPANRGYIPLTESNIKDPIVSDFFHADAVRWLAFTVFVVFIMLVVFIVFVIRKCLVKGKADYPTPVWMFNGLIGRGVCDDRVGTILSPTANEDKDRELQPSIHYHTLH